MKVGIIRCLQTEEYCPGTADFRAVRERTGAFAGEEQVEIVGFINCGGCPGKKALLRARELVKRGADTVCKKMRELIEVELGEKVRLLDHTH